MVALHGLEAYSLLKLDHLSIAQVALPLNDVLLEASNLILISSPI